MKRVSIAIILAMLISIAPYAYASSAFPEKNNSDAIDMLYDTQYEAIVSADSLLEQYQAIDKTEAGLSAYVNVINDINDLLGNKQLKDVITTITFSEYLEFESLQNYIENYGIDARQLQLRAITDDGTILTVFTRTDRGLQETESILNKQAEDGNYTLVGITAMNALVDGNNLKSISADTRTYLADTTGDMAFLGCNSDSNGDVRNSSIPSTTGGRFPHSLTWDLEELGILK